MRLMKDKRGFSLVELIIVIVIIGIIVAVLAPQYFKYVEKSREVVCAENMAEARNGFRLEKVEPSDSDAKSVMDQVMTDMGAETVEGGKNYKGLCPAGGVTSVEYTEDDVIITCSKHSANRSPIMGDPSVDLSTAFNSLGFDLAKGKRLDSSADNGTTVKKLKEALVTVGVDLAKDNIASWAVVNTKGDAAIGSGEGLLYLWSSYDVSKYKTGDQLPVMCYNSTTGKYTVALSNVGTGTTGTDNYTVIGQGSEKNGFGNTENSKLESSNFDSYAEALEAYSKLTPKVK